MDPSFIPVLENSVYSVKGFSVKVVQEQQTIYITDPGEEHFRRVEFTALGNHNYS